MVHAAYRLKTGADDGPHRTAERKGNGNDEGILAGNKKRDGREGD